MRVRNVFAAALENQVLEYIPSLLLVLDPHLSSQSGEQMFSRFLSVLISVIFTYEASQRRGALVIF